MFEDIKKSSEYIRREKERQSKIERKINEETEKSSIQEMCSYLELITQRDEFKVFIELLKTRLNLRIEQRNSIINTEMVEFEYLKKSIMYDSEINLLNDIINTPDNFRKILNSLKEDK